MQDSARVDRDIRVALMTFVDIALRELERSGRDFRPANTDRTIW